MKLGCESLESPLSVSPLLSSEQTGMCNASSCRYCGGNVIMGTARLRSRTSASSGATGSTAAGINVAATCELRKI